MTACPGFQLSQDAVTCRPLLLLVATYAAHFSFATQLLRSLATCVTDRSTASIRFIVSDGLERQQFVRQLEEHLPRAWASLDGARAHANCGQVLDVSVVTLQDVTRPWGVVPNMYNSSKGIGMEESFTGPSSSNKYHFQMQKKLYGARFFNYSRALILDSENVVVHPFSLQTLFDDFFSRRPILTVDPHHPMVAATYRRRVWSFRRRKGYVYSTRFLQTYCDGLLKLDRPSTVNTSVPLWTDHRWFVEKPIIEALHLHIEKRHNTSLYEASAQLFRKERCFEYPLYQQFVLRSTGLRRSFLAADYVSAANSVLPAHLVARWGLPALEFYTAWLGLVNITVAEEEQALAALARLVESLRLTSFRVPAHLEMCKPYYGRRPDCQTYYTRVGRLLNRCPTLTFCMHSDGILQARRHVRQMRLI